MADDHLSLLAQYAHQHPHRAPVLFLLILAQGLIGYQSWMQHQAIIADFVITPATVDAIGYPAAMLNSGEEFDLRAR
jgi:hypothetical protein